MVKEEVKDILKAGQVITMTSQDRVKAKIQVPDGTKMAVALDQETLKVTDSMVIQVTDQVAEVVV